MKTIVSNPFRLMFGTLLSSSLLTACGLESENNTSKSSQLEPGVFAINLGGEDYVAADGVQYLADGKWVTGGTTQSMDNVLGTPDIDIYRTYRIGEITVDAPMSDGLYDISLLFAEPREIKPGEHVFNIDIEGKTILAEFDAYAVGKGKNQKAYARTFPRIKVEDGEFNMSLTPLQGKPVLSAVVLRPHTKDHAKGYKLLWADEFDKDGSPDPNRWNYILWDARKVNDENQGYTDFARNVRVEDGRLILEAHKEDHRNAHYTSGRITSEGHGDLLYGRVEVRAKLPYGGGTWPAIWMYPTDRFKYSEPGCSEETKDEKRCVAWPHSGEFDIMEHVGNNPGIVHSTIHTKSYYWVNGFQRSGTISLPEPNDGFHTYALNWTPERMDVFMDDTLYFTYVKEQGADWQSWPFDHPYHLILNLAVGGWWGRDNGGIDETAFPQRMEVDYVRFYEPSAD